MLPAVLFYVIAARGSLAPFPLILYLYISTHSIMSLMMVS